MGIHKYQKDKSVPYQNKKSIALVPKKFNWPKTIKPTTLGSWFKVAGGSVTHASSITGSNFRVDYYTLLASSQHVGATPAVTILLFSFLLLEQ